MIGMTLEKIQNQFNQFHLQNAPEQIANVMVLSGLDTVDISSTKKIVDLTSVILLASKKPLEIKLAMKMIVRKEQTN